MEEVDRMPCFLSLFETVGLVFELIHICDSWCCCLQPTSSAGKSESSSFYALAFRWFLSLIISLNASMYSSSPNGITSNEGMQSQQVLTDFVSKWRTLFANGCIHFLLWCRQFRNGWYSFFVNLEKILLVYLTYYRLVQSNRSFIHASQNNLMTGGFPPKHPMIDLHGNIFCPNKMLPRNSPVITLICLLMSLYTSNIILIPSLLVPSFQADAKIVSVR